jgi:Tol biopolymer transport system component/C-terminal processing protease CtpA/Prc
MTNAQTSGRPYFRTPVVSPDGTRIAFLYASDIWLVPAEGGDAARLTAHSANHFSPRWSPDGEYLAFSSARTGNGDIYVLPLQSGAVQRVTYHDAASTTEAWSADGAHIFFSSARERQGTAIYCTPVKGGTPILWVGQPYENLNNLAVSPDGSMLVFNLSRDSWFRRGPNIHGGAEIWVRSNTPDADDYRNISQAAGANRWPMWAPDGAGVYFVSDRDGNENIWFQSLTGEPARRITSFNDGRLLWPSISCDGRVIVFERDFSLWRLDVGSGSVGRLDVQARQDTKTTHVRVHPYNRDISELALAPDGKKVAFVVRGEVFADFADKETDKERRQGPAIRITNTPFRERDVTWSPDSRKLAYTSDRHGDEEVFLYDVANHTETRLTMSERPSSAPQFSPDGAWLAYACGNDELRVLNIATHEDRLFVRATFAYGAYFAWSPDSAWLVYVAQDERLFSNLYVKRIDGDQPRQITFLSNLQAHTPLWAPNGQFIIFTTYHYRAEAQIARVNLRPQPPFFREEEFEKLFTASDERRKTNDEPQPASEELPAADDELLSKSDQVREKESAAPARTADTKTQPPSVEIVFEGIERRRRFLTPTQMDAMAYCISPDSRDLIFSASVAGKSNLWTLPLDEPRQEQPPRQLTSGGSSKFAAQFVPDGKTYYFLDGGQIVIRKFPSGDPTSLPIYAEVLIDFNREKLQMFDECWRLLRDHFYDPTFRGLDWGAMREQFTPLITGAQTYNELTLLINLMLGELRSSHLGIGYRGGGGQDGYIGLLFDPVEQSRTGALRIAEIVPESPAALAKDADGENIRVGDYLLAVDDTTLDPSVNLDMLLQRTIGRRVRLRIGAQPDSVDNVREFAVRPASGGQYDEQRYRAWVYKNEAYVHQISDGRLGYVHIPDMDYAAYQQFLSDLDTETHSKEGVIIDVRFNTGGHISTFILDVLTRRSVLLSGFRDQPAIDAGHTHGNRILNKPTVLVVNEASASNTEIFAEGYRQLALGRIVGRPTAGAVIGTFERRLIDGSYFRLPRIKIMTPEGEDLEGASRAVDIDVALPLGSARRERDPQLDAAVQTLLEQISARGKV